jgi:hypothetical protein
MEGWQEILRRTNYHLLLVSVLKSHRSSHQRGSVPYALHWPRAILGNEA